MPDITPIVAAFLLYIKQGETPANSADMACIDVFPIMMERNEQMTIRIAREQIFSFLHPEIPERIKSGAKLLQFSYLNFDALAEGEIDSINKYIDDKNRYFGVQYCPFDWYNLKSPEESLKIKTKLSLRGSKYQVRVEINYIKMERIYFKPIVKFYTYRTALPAGDKIFSCRLGSKEISELRKTLALRGYTFDNHICWRTENACFVYSDNNLTICTDLREIKW